MYGLRSKSDSQSSAPDPSSVQLARHGEGTARPRPSTSLVWVQKTTHQKIVHLVQGPTAMLPMLLDSQRDLVLVCQPHSAPAHLAPSAPEDKKA